MEASRSTGSTSRLPFWRLVAAAFLHFGIIAYPIVVIPLLLVLMPAKGGVEDMVRLGVRLSGLFLLGFLMLGGVAMAIASILDRRARRQSRRASATEPALAQGRVAGAVALAGRSFDSALGAMLEQIAGRAWNYQDDRYQALARDLDMVVRRAVAAQTDAPHGMAPGVMAECTTSLGLIDQALVALEHERASAAATELRAAALYIQRRYGAADFAIKPD